MRGGTEPDANSRTGLPADTHQPTTQSNTITNPHTNSATAGDDRATGADQHAHSHSDAQSYCDEHPYAVPFGDVHGVSHRDTNAPSPDTDTQHHTDAHDHTHRASQYNAYTAVHTHAPPHGCRVEGCDEHPAHRP